MASERRTFSPSELRTSDVDYAAIARKLNTSDLVLCLALHEARLSIVDPDGALTKALGPLGGLLDFRPEVKAAHAELEARLIALLRAAAAELDRRMPIPEGA